MSWSQKKFTLPAKSRGSYLITDHVLKEVPEISDYKIGMLNLFVRHTSCALSLNENWDDDVRADMSDALDRIAPMDPEGELYRHSAEGEDDMPVRVEYLVDVDFEAGTLPSQIQHFRFESETDPNRRISNPP